MNLEQTKEGKVLVVRVRENRIDAHLAPDLKQQLGDLIDSGDNYLVLDLGDVEFVDSSGLSAIVSAMKLLDGRGDIVLCQPQPAVTSLFKLTRLDKIFRIFPDSAGAVAAVAN